MSRKNKSSRRRYRHKLVIHPHEALKQVAEPVEKFDKDLQNLVHDMFYICRVNNVKGAGLAANQVGVLKRVIVINGPDFIGAMVNPLIVQIDHTKVEIKEEGCLSYPGIVVSIERSIEIAVMFSDITGKTSTVELTGFTARVVQHEIDHLNGVNILDYIKKYTNTSLTS